MKKIRTILILSCTIIAAFAVSAFTGRAKTYKTGNTKGFAVVELFTSEGCSSCPPADEVVAKIQKETTDQPVFILVYHVDYWDRLGWRDAFSNAAYTERQKKYSSWIENSSVYTPQIVVNGKQQFIGSEEGTLRNAIKEGEQKSSSSQISLNGLKVADGKASFQYTAQGLSGSTSLIVAVVEHAAQTQVKGGENNGLTLSHVQIVRQLQTIPLKGKTNGDATIDLPKDLNPADLQIVAFLQNQNNGKITAAYKTELNAVAKAM